MIGTKGNETVFLVPEYGGGGQLILVLPSEVPPDAQETLYFPSDHAKQSLYRVNRNAKIYKADVLLLREETL